MKIRISSNAEREVGKALINVFYLTIVGVFVTYTLTNNEALGVWSSLPYIVMSLISLLAGAMLISHADKRKQNEEDKSKSMITEVKKGIFHVQQAEIKKAH